MLGFGRPELPSQGALDAFQGHGYDEKEIGEAFGFILRRCSTASGCAADRPSVQTKLVSASVAAASSPTSLPPPAQYGPPAAGSPSGGKVLLQPLSHSGSLGKLPALTVSPKKRMYAGGQQSDNVSAAMKDVDPSGAAAKRKGTRTYHSSQAPTEISAAMRQDTDTHHEVGVRSVSGAVGGVARRKQEALRQSSIASSGAPAPAASPSNAAGSGSGAAPAPSQLHRLPVTQSAPAAAPASGPRVYVPPVQGIAQIATSS